MKKHILFLLTIIILLTLQPLSVNAATDKVAKPTISVIEANPGITTLSVKCTTKGAIIYYTTDGTTPTTKSADWSKNRWQGFDTDKLSSVKFRAYYKGSYSTTVSVPKVTLTAKPTYKVTVTDKGDIKVTITSDTKGAKIYYNFKPSGTITTSDEYILSGETITMNYKKYETNIQFVAYANKAFSSRNSVKLDQVVDQKYKALVKEIVSRETKGLTTSEEKLIALWTWTMENTAYAFKADGRTPDDTYRYGTHLLFDGKAVCNGFALLWQDMANTAGFETEYIVNKKLNHAYCVTKVNGKWFIVDSTHTDKMNGTEDSRLYYNGFLDNSQYANFSTNYYGFDCSSKRYVIGDSTYFDFLEYVDSGEAWFVYDETTDRYTIHDIYEEE